MEGRLGKVYYSDKDFTDAEVAAQFRFPCVIRVRNVATRKIIKETHYDPSGVASIAYFGEGGGSVELDAVIAMGEITTTSSTVDVALHSSGSNQVRIGGLIYSKNTPSNFTYTQVTDSNLKSLIIYALPTTEMLYLAEGVAGQEAVEPELPSGALFVRKIIVSHDNQYVDAESLSGFREKAVDGWKLHPVSSPAPTYLVVDDSKKCNFSIVQLSSTTEVNIAGIYIGVSYLLYDGLGFTITNDCAVDINLVSQAEGSNQKAFMLPRSPFKVKSGQSIKLYYSASQDAILPLLLSSDAQITFATQPEMESQTPPDTENNKAVSLFGLWKWNKNLKYLYLTNSVANAIPNKDWSDGINRWYTNKDGINKRYALVDSSPPIDKIALLTSSGTLKPISNVPINPLIKIYGESSEGVISYNDTVQAKKVDTSNTEPTILQLIEKGVDRVDYPNLGRIYFNYGTKWGYITLNEVTI